MSGSRDYTVKVFDWSKSSAKKAVKTIQEVEWVRSIGLHPAGDWIVGRLCTNEPEAKIMHFNRRASETNCGLHIPKSVYIVCIGV